MATTSVTGITSSGLGLLGIGSQITFTLTTDKAVTVTGTPVLNLSNGAKASFAGLVSGKPTFTYTVAEGDTATPSLTVTGLDTSGGTINGPAAAVQFAEQPKVATAGSTPFGIAAADLDGDGNVDFVAGTSGGSVSVRFGDGAGGFTRSLNVPSGTATRGVAIVDINGDGKLDILTANEGSRNVSILLGNGLGNFTASTPVATQRAIDVIAVDLNGDGKLDIVTADFADNALSVRLSNGNGGFLQSQTLATRGPRNVVAADVNGDGKLDLLASNDQTGGVSLFLNNGAGGFGTATVVSDLVLNYDLAVGDVNGDGRADLVVGERSDARVGVYLGNDSGGFTASPARSVSVNGPWGLTLSDLDGDGDLDIVAVNGNVASIRLNDGNGFFSVTPNITVGPLALSVVATDVDKDGKPDLLVTNGSGNNVSVLLNRSTPAAPFDAATVGTATGAASGRAVDAVRPTAPTLALANDTGASGTDTITSDGTLTLGGLEDGATLSYVVDGGPATGSYDPALLADGLHTVSVTQKDAAGNLSSAGSLTFTLDRTGPTLASVAVTGPDVAAGTGTLTTGQTATITLTLSEAVALSGAVPSLTLSNGATAVFDGNASTSTELVFTYTVALEAVSSDLAIGSFDGGGVTIRDVAGNDAQIIVGDIPGTLVIDGYTGTGGIDVFRGTSGAETFKGLGGNDRYYVDNAGDTVIEAAGEGTDTVYTVIDYALAAHVESIVARVDGLSLTGNEARNSLSDIAAGSLGTTMDGGGEADTYYVRNSASTVNDTGSSGVDRVLAYADFDAGTNGSGIEYIFDAVGGLSLTGNSGANRLHDLAGGAGSTLDGGDGNDVFYVRNASTTVGEAESDGMDTVFASVDFALGANIENLRALGSTDLRLTGNDLKNTIIGGEGDDVINGLDGVDTLVGGAGSDQFVFSTTLGKANIARITDFSRADDTISLDGVNIFGALSFDDSGVLEASQFTTITRGQAYGQDARIIYETDTGRLFYDADGFKSQGAFLLATLVNRPSDLDHTDFTALILSP